MGKRKLITGIVGGAVIGGIVALFDRETRNYAKNKLEDAKATTSDIIKNPTATIRNVQIAVDQFNKKLNYQTENAINALEQVEDTVKKVSGKVKRIEQ